MKASVIIPAWGDTPYLAETRSCLAAQSLKDFEVIVAAPPPGEENAGAARNAGLSQAKGEWIFFVDADDCPTPDYLESAIAAGEKSGADVVAFRADEVDVKLGTRASMPYLSRIVPWSDGRIHSLDELGEKRFVTLGIAPWNKAVRRDFLFRHGITFQSIRRADDVAFTVELLATANTFCALDQSLIGYRVNNSKSQEATNSETPLNFYHALIEAKRRLAGRHSAALHALAEEMIAYHLHSVRNVEAYRKVLDFLAQRAFGDFGIAVPGKTLKRMNGVSFAVCRALETLKDRGLMFCLRRFAGRMVS